MATSRHSVARLMTFLLTFLIVSLLYPSAKLVTHCTRESTESGFSLKTWFCAAAQKWKSRGLRSGLWAGRVPICHAFLDDDGHLTPVNGECYLSLLQNTVWPKLRYTATRSSLWWMQDGAPPHCTNSVLAFLNEKFQGRVISRRTANPWPAHSPDLNPLDFHFRAAAQNQVFQRKTWFDRLSSAMRD